jgi:hypothetical protein
MKVEFIFPFTPFAERSRISSFASILAKKTGNTCKGNFEFDIKFDFKVDFYWASDDDAALIKHRSEKLSYSYIEAYVVFSGEIDEEIYIANNTKKHSWMKDWTRDQHLSYVKGSITGIFKSNIDHFILCSYLASPFIEQLDDGVIFVNGEYHQNVKPITPGYFDLDDFCRSLRMPVLRAFEISDVWSWYTKTPGMMVGVTESRLGRALVYFSKLFGVSEAKQKFSSAVWAISGIEALLADSQGGIERQIKERLNALIPSIYSKDIERHIADMYGFRSRVLHGQVDIATSLNYYTMEIND